MADFDYYIDKKVTIWGRELYTVKAKNKKAADKLIMDQIKKDREIEVEGKIIFDEYEIMHDTEEELSVEENGGCSTMELYDSDGNMLLDNTKG